MQEVSFSHTMISESFTGSLISGDKLVKIYRAMFSAEGLSFLKGARSLRYW